MELKHITVSCDVCDDVMTFLTVINTKCVVLAPEKMSAIASDDALSCFNVSELKDCQLLLTACLSRQQRRLWHNKHGVTFKRMIGGIAENFFLLQ